MKVVAAAVKFKWFPSNKEYQIFTAKRHIDIYEIMRDLRLPYDKDSCIEGFMTDTDQFVNRVEAKKIAVAANQLIVPEEDTYPALYSEDVW